MYRTIIWATDGSEWADRALVEARELTRLSGANLIAVHCDQRIASGRVGGLSVDLDEADVREKLWTQVEALRAEGLDVELVVEATHRSPVQLVTTVATDMQADLIVCGTRGLGSLSGGFLGSFTHRLLQVAPCPVLAVGPRSRVRKDAAELQPGAAG
jgi:nucleotide-binding universal stress UspA family protein